VRFMLHVLLLLVFAAPACADVVGEVVWSGTKVIEASQVVTRGSTLTIEPGTVLRFARGAALTVEGRLLAKGSAAQPIRFLPAETGAEAGWPGIAFQNAVEPGVLEQVRIENADVGVSIVGSRVAVTASSLQGGGKGIALAVDADVTIDQVTLRGMREGAIDASVRSRARISGCRIETVAAGFGIQVSKQAIASIRNNHIVRTKFGILATGDFPPLEGNVIEHCEVGIGLVQSGPGSVVRANRVSNCGTGIGCRQFCSPQIEQNQLEGCKIGIECYQGASPLIRGNRIAGCEQGLSCVQMCNPQVSGNSFADNRTAAYLHLSSYAVFRGNNFERNTLHIDLDNMSYDWEQRASHKPKRNRQAQNEVLAQQGRAVAKEIEVEVDSEGFVDASGNYWGEETTREMEAKGADANIDGINDGFDVPLLSYEGWQGEYKKDRVKYSGWLTSPAEVAAVPPDS